MSGGSGNLAKLPTGRRIVIRTFSNDQQAALGDLLEEPQPPPSLNDLEDGDIVVAVRATEIVWTDTVMATGQYQHRPRLPYSPGMSYAGVVQYATPTAAAAGVAAGTRVAVAGHDAGPRSLGRHQKYGGCATYAIAPYTAVRMVPDEWTFAEASCFAYGYDTAYHCIVECGRVARGETVLILGASGGVGIVGGGGGWG
jgi:NADPH2:quinone reductase